MILSTRSARVKRMLPECRDEGSLAEDDAALGAAEKFVATEEDKVGPGAEAVLGGGLRVESVGDCIEEGPAADVVHQHKAVRVSEFSQLSGSGFGGEAHYSEVAGVHPHDHGRVRGDGPGVVASVGAVRSADFHEMSAAGLHDLGNAKAPTYLY